MAAPGRAAEGHDLADEAPVEDRTSEQQDGSQQHRDGAVAPAVSPNEGGGDAESADADERLAAAMALGALPAAALVKHEGVVGEPGVSEQREADQPDEGAEYDGDMLESHAPRSCKKGARGQGALRPFSCASSQTFRSMPPPKPVIEPSAPMTRWQGTMIAIGFRPLAAPTARIALGFPTRVASST